MTEIKATTIWDLADQVDKIWKNQGDHSNLDTTSSSGILGQWTEGDFGTVMYKLPGENHSFSITKAHVDPAGNIGTEKANAWAATQGIARRIIASENDVSYSGKRRGESNTVIEEITFSDNYSNIKVTIESSHQ